jgi:hypothetical protein
VLVSGDPLTDITATRAIERIWRAGVLCDRGAVVASAAEVAEVDAFYAQVAKAVTAVRERRSGFGPTRAGVGGLDRALRQEAGKQGSSAAPCLSRIAH